MKPEIMNQIDAIFITTNIKGVSHKIKNTPAIMSELDACYGETVMEKIWNAKHPDTNVCPNGKPRKFKSIYEGYINCGNAKNCQCTRDTVSQKLILANASKTASQKAATQKLREETVQGKYGVSNVGQTPAAIQKHEEYYMKLKESKETDVSTTNKGDE
jgi:hypothetical protein